MSDQPADEITTEEISEMKEQGDLFGYLRHLNRTGVQLRDAKVTPPVEPTPGHIPGAWPLPSASGPGLDQRQGKVCDCRKCKSYAKPVHNDGTQQ